MAYIQIVLKSHELKNSWFHFHLIKYIYGKKKFEDTKSETINWRTDNTKVYRQTMIHKTLKTGGELRCSGRESSSCSTCGTHRVPPITNTVKSHEWGKDRIVIMTNRKFPWSFETRYTVNLVMVQAIKLYQRKNKLHFTLPVMSLPCLGFSAVLDFFSGVLITVEASLSNIDVS